MSNGSTVRSVERAIGLMELLAIRTSAGVTELAQEMDVHKSTAFRLLATLERQGMVEQDERTSKYRLGPGLARLARTVDEEVDLRRHARPTLEKLAEETAETVNLALLDGDDIIYVDQVNGSPSVLTAEWLGRRTPLHCTASGKVLLAALSEERRRRLLNGGLDVLTNRTVADIEELDTHLEETRKRGYGVTVGELELGLNAVSAPVHRADGEVVAAITVSGPAARIPPERLADVGERTREAAQVVSRRLGHRPRSG